MCVDERKRQKVELADWVISEILKLVKNGEV